jgi:phosphatidylserine/phosphatidylglycerophosphate/cardiolipin synthase-like enzyme
MCFRRTLFAATLAIMYFLLAPSRADAAQYTCDALTREPCLCDAAAGNCRSRLLDLIKKEVVGIDVVFWFMEDHRYAAELERALSRGVPVRLIVDSRANATYPANAVVLDRFKSYRTASGAAFPMREKYTGGIQHRKFMLFHGQNMVEFSGANYSDEGFNPPVPFINYVDEAIYYANKPSVVDSFKTLFDNMWTSTTGFRNYANVIGPLVRMNDPYPIDTELNFPPSDALLSLPVDESYASRATKRYKAENVGIDVTMYRITHLTQSDAILAAHRRGVAVRLYSDTTEYRNTSRLWHAWNIDRLWLAGIPLKVPAHDGMNHQKSITLKGQRMTIFGSSNWTGPSSNSQTEHNYFTTDPYFFDWFSDQFDRKWNNTMEATTGRPETKAFVPLPPTERPSYRTPAAGAIGMPTTGAKLVWWAGPWAHIYDVYFGTSSPPPLFAENLALGPSERSTDTQSLVLPALQPGTTYYWKIVSKTAALMQREGVIWSFTTAGDAPAPLPPPAGAVDIVLWAAHVPQANVVGNWHPLPDATAAGGTALWNQNQGAAKVATALANPPNHFEQTFTAVAGTPYHVWVRIRPQSSSRSNDSVHLQFNGSVDAMGTPIMRIGTTGSAAFILQGGSADTTGHSGWGWTDNGWDAQGAHVYFAHTGPQTVRVQPREDGAIVDQIVMSPSTYLTAAPGPRENDTTILPANSGNSSDPPEEPPTDPPPPSATAALGPGDILLAPANPTTILVGNWARTSDPTAAGGFSLLNANLKAAKITTASALPADYFEMTFDAAANTAYRLWIRGKAAGDYWSNDSVFVQFSGSVTQAGAPVFRIGSTGATAYTLEDCSGCGLSGWGWQDNGYGGVMGPLIYFESGGPQTLRIQVREDGLAIDQILLSPEKFLNQSPGALKDDTVIFQ